MKSETFSISKHLPVLVLLVFLSFFAHLGKMPLFDTDEGVYSEVTREMVADRDFTSIRLNGKPFFHKPPLYYWAQAASIKILGLSEFSLRLPSAIAALLWSASIFLFTRRYYDTETAWYATLFMSGSLLVTFLGRLATPDGLFSLFITLTLFNIYRFHHNGNRRHIYWSFMFAALGILTKGAVALLLPASVSIVFFMLQKSWKDMVRLFLNPVGLMVFCLIVVPWYLGELMLHGDPFPGGLLLLSVPPPTGYEFIGSSLPYYSYPVVIFIGLLPFSAIFVKALFHIRQYWTDDLLQFMIVWFILALLFMPLVQPHSLFSSGYCFPPLFIIMARTTGTIRHAVNIFIPPLLLIAFLFLVPFAAPYTSGPLAGEFIRNLSAGARLFLDSSYLLIMGAVLLLLVLLPFIKPVPRPMQYAVLVLLFVSVIHFLVMPILGSIMQQPVKSAALLAKNERYDVITWRVRNPSFNVYGEMLTRESVPDRGDIIFTRSRYLGDTLHYRPLYEKNGVILAKILEKPDILTNGVLQAGP